MDNLQAWLIAIWIGAAVIFFVAEIFTAGFFLICFGVGAMGAAASAMLGVDPIWQLAIFVALSALALVFVRPFAARVSSGDKNEVGIDRVLGKRAVVIDEIDPLRGKGIVRVAQEEWRAESDDGERIPRDAEVEVCGVQGTRLIVKLTQHPDLQGAVQPAA